MSERLGEGLDPIGFHAFRGQAVNHARASYPILPAPPGTLEHRLAEAGWRVALFDLEQLAADVDPPDFLD